MAAVPASVVFAQTPPAGDGTQQLLRQQERERLLRQQSRRPGPTFGGNCPCQTRHSGFLRMSSHVSGSTASRCKATPPLISNGPWAQPIPRSTLPRYAALAPKASASP